MAVPQTRYAKSGDVRIAYQVVGNGPIDLVFVPGFISNLEVHWEDPGYSRLFAPAAIPRNCLHSGEKPRIFNALCFRLDAADGLGNQ